MDNKFSIHDVKSQEFLLEAALILENYDFKPNEDDDDDCWQMQ